MIYQQQQKNCSFLQNSCSSFYMFRTDLLTQCRKIVGVDVMEVIARLFFTVVYVPFSVRQRNGYFRFCCCLYCQYKYIIEGILSFLQSINKK